MARSIRPCPCSKTVARNAIWYAHRTMGHAVELRPPGHGRGTPCGHGDHKAPAVGLGSNMGFRLLVTAALIGAAAILSPCHSVADEAKQETVIPVFSQALPNLEGKTFTAAIVNFSPGLRAAPHRHGEAFVFAYVLSGVFRSQIEGGPVRTYKTGQHWSEAPGAHHILTQNASTTEPAALLVVFISDTGEQLKIDDSKGSK